MDPTVQSPVLEALEQARTETEEIRSHEEERPRVLATALVKQASFAALAGELGESRSCFEEARALYQKLGDFDSVARCLLYLARIARSDKDGPTARQQLDLSTWLFQRVEDDAGRGEVALERGEMALAEESLDEADRRFREARELFRSAGQPAREISALKAAGLSRQFSNRIPDAIATYQEALTLAEGLEDAAQILEITLALGGLESSRANFSVARRLLRTARELAAEQDDSAKQALALVHLAAIDGGQGKLGKAEEQALESRRLAVEAVDVSTYILAATLLSQLMKAQGRDVDCIDVLLRAANGLGDLMGAEGRKPMEEMLEALRAEWGEGRYQSALAAFVERQRQARN